MNNGASFVGRVVSNRMQKTVVVAVDRLVWVPKLKTFERRTSRHLAHCDLGEGLVPSGPAAAATATTTSTAASAASAASAAGAGAAGAGGGQQQQEGAAGAQPPPSPLHVGDVVRIAWTPRQSRHKSYRVERVLRRARVYSPSLGEAALAEHRARRAAEEAGAAAAALAGGARVARAEVALDAARRRMAELRGAYEREVIGKQASPSSCSSSRS